MTAQYQVQFSEEDLFHIEGDYGRMHGNIVPTPDVGHYLVKTSGIFEVAHVSYSMDGHFDVYLRPVVTQTADGDAIVVHSKERYYRCINRDGQYGFRRITVLSLLNLVSSLEGKLHQLESKIDQLQAHVDSLIQ